MYTSVCCSCAQRASRDVVALNKKLLGRSTRGVLCLTCLAQYLECTEDDLRQRIEEFREAGCTLFVAGKV